MARARPGAATLGHQRCNTDPTTLKCRWPFVRMAGSPPISAVATRRTTAPTISTPASAGTQWETEYHHHALQIRGEAPATHAASMCSWAGRPINFFLYAKRATTQTYQSMSVRVSPDTDLKAQRATLNNMPVNKFTLSRHGPPPEEELQRRRVAQVTTSGILQVRGRFSADRSRPRSRQWSVQAKPSARRMAVPAPAHWTRRPIRW